MENLRERDHLQDLRVGGSTIYKFAIQDIGWKGLDWINLAEDRDNWRAAVNTVMNNSIYPFNVLIWNILTSLIPKGNELSGSMKCRKFLD
jgi:hypothetical protein